MATILKSKSIYFNDVVIIPGITTVNSRSHIPKELGRIFASPMPAVTGTTFTKRALELGLSVCLHRFGKVDDQVSVFRECVSQENENRLFAAVGLDDWDRVRCLSNAGCKNFLLDIANGTVPTVKNFCNILSRYPVDNFMAGNIVTAEGLANLYDSMGVVDARRYLIRVGQGNGVSCQTSDETGINRGQITELMECREWLNTRRRIGSKSNIEILSDGGINKAGSICKAFGAGADGVLIGGLFAQTLEAETNISGDGTYFGCASEKAQRLLKGESFRHTEGKELNLRGDLIPLEKLVNQLWGGISSCISYAGYQTVKDFIGNAIFEIKENSLPPKVRY